MLLHHNSGTSQWFGADEIMDPDVILSEEDKKKIVDNLCERVRKQRPSRKDTKKVLEQFFQSQGRAWSSADSSTCRDFKPGVSRDAIMPTCASCGYRKIDTGMKLRYCLVKLEDLEILKLNKEEADEHRARICEPSYNPTLPCDDSGRAKLFELWKLYGIYPQVPNAKEYYHLHPEFVKSISRQEEEDNESDSDSDSDRDYGVEKTCMAAMICDQCHTSIKRGKLPAYSLANGVDHGVAHRIGLEPLSVIELHILSLVRTYIQIIKIETNTGRQRDHTQSSLRGNCIHFPHDSPSVLCKVLEVENMASDICIQFAGSKGEYDHLFRRLHDMDSAHVMGRAYNLYAWYSVLRVVNRLYADEPEPPVLNELQKQLKEVNRILVGDAIKTFDDALVENRMIQSDDVAQIRTTSQSTALHEMDRDSSSGEEVRRRQLLDVHSQVSAFFSFSF